MWDPGSATLGTICGMDPRTAGAVVMCIRSQSRYHGHWIQPVLGDGVREGGCFMGLICPWTGSIPFIWPVRPDDFYTPAIRYDFLTSDYS